MSFCFNAVAGGAAISPRLHWAVLLKARNSCLPRRQNPRQKRPNSRRKVLFRSKDFLRFAVQDLP